MEDGADLRRFHRGAPGRSWASSRTSAYAVTLICAVLSLAGCSARSGSGADGEDGVSGATSAESSGETLDDAGAWYGDDPDDCELPTVDAEILACGAQAWQLAIGLEKVFWVAGSRGACSPACPAPAIYSVAKDGGGRTVVANLPETARTIAAGSRLVFATNDTLFEIMPGGDLEVLDTQGVHDLRAAGDMVYWSGASDGVVWKSADGTKSAAVEWDASIGRFALSAEGIAWASLDGLELFSSLSGGSAIAELESSLTDLAVRDDVVFWGTGDGIFSVPLTGGVVSTLAQDTDIVALDLDDHYLYYGAGYSPGSLRRVPTTGGAAETLVSYSDAMVSDVALDSGFVYWIDGRIVRRRAG